jgi:hypothetical protein
MQALFAGLEDVYRSDIWRIARVTSPELVLRYDTGCLNHLAEAEYFAAQRILWIVERHGVVVATIRRSDDEHDAVFWKEPELIEIAACQPAWQLLPTWLQAPIWRRLLTFIRGEEPVVHDRPELRRLAERTFRIRVYRAIGQGNDQLVMALAEDCPFWRLGRDDLLQQHPVELRRWCRLLRPPKHRASEFAIFDFVRALRHAAGLIDATLEENGP